LSVSSVCCGIGQKTGAAATRQARSAGCDPRRPETGIPHPGLKDPGPTQVVSQERLFYYGRPHDVKAAFKDCQKRGHLLFHAHNVEIEDLRSVFGGSNYKSLEKNGQANPATETGDDW